MKELVRKLITLAAVLALMTVSAVFLSGCSCSGRGTCGSCGGDGEL